jgi:hypothetical protein
MQPTWPGTIGSNVPTACTLAKEVPLPPSIPPPSTRLRHRLLPQPGGFEGFNAVEKHRIGQAIAEVQALVELKLNLNDRRPS